MAHTMTTSNGLQASFVRDNLSLVVPVRQASLSPSPAPHSLPYWAEYGGYTKRLERGTDDFLVMPVRRGSLNSLSTWPEYSCSESYIDGDNGKVSTTKSSLYTTSEECTEHEDPRTETCLTKKCVCFAPERSNSTAFTMCLEDYTTKEHKSCWYSRQELDTMLHYTTIRLHRDTRWKAGASLDHMYDSKMWSKMSSKGARAS